MKIEPFLLTVKSKFNLQGTEGLYHNAKQSVQAYLRREVALQPSTSCFNQMQRNSEMAYGKHRYRLEEIIKFGTQTNFGPANKF